MTFTPPRMDAVESRAWLALIATCELLPAALDAQLQADAGMSHFEFQLLGRLNLAGHHTLQLKELAVATNSSLPRLSKAIKRLESRGGVTRSPHPEDRRATNAHLTQDGRRAMILATPGHLETVRAGVLAKLSHEQLEHLAEALEPVVAGLDPKDHFRLVRAEDADEVG